MGSLPHGGLSHARDGLDDLFRVAPLQQDASHLFEEALSQAEEVLAEAHRMWGHEEPVLCAAGRSPSPGASTASVAPSSKGPDVSAALQILSRLRDGGPAAVIPNLATTYPGYWQSCTQAGVQPVDQGTWTWQ